MNSIILSLIYVLTSCILLFIAKKVFDKVSPFKPEEQIKKSNCTPIISFCAYMIGITFILAGAFIGPTSNSAKLDFLLYILYALLGIILMNCSSFVINKILFNKFNNTKELLEDKNIGTAAVHFGVYLASGLIIAACVNGEYGGLISTVVYYFLGMTFLYIFLKVYDIITPYSIHDELEKDNYAVGIALSGNIIAIGIILMKATLGDVLDWHRSIILYFADLAAIILLLPSLRFILGNIIVKSININIEITNNNVAAGLIEFISVVCFALIIFFTVDFGVIL